MKTFKYNITKVKALIHKSHLKYIITYEESQDLAENDKY